MKCLWGIDPGTYGALACLGVAGRRIPEDLVFAHVYPLPGRREGRRVRAFLIEDFSRMVFDLSDDMFPSLVVLETFGGHPGNSSKSVHYQGRVIGAIEGVLSCAGIEYRLVYPVQWRKAVSSYVDLSGSPKEAAMRAATALRFHDLVPEEEWKSFTNKKLQSGAYDAYLIAISGVSLLEDDDG